MGKRTNGETGKGMRKVAEGGGKRWLDWPIDREGKGKGDGKKVREGGKEGRGRKWERDGEEGKGRRDKAKDILKNAPGVVVIDDHADNRFPTPLEVSNKDAVAVGRIRRDVGYLCCGDQIRKGAALNAVQIAEMLLK
ncbi:hypothetical protein ACH5RR_036467 [Cinchona calisaya]|uniref:Semialdehyde dehydrogenase dimerisation domain-containing protein n=1 Tax=Cinchona calisaya TaxID=153742 RepID=A0ABD2Y3E1_9GENT